MQSFAVGAMQIILVLLATVLAGWLGSVAAAGAQYPLLILIGAASAAIFAFFSPKLSLALLVFSMLLSPEIGFGGAVDSNRSAVLRYDDILLVVIFFSWFARTAVSKERSFITSTPVQTPILLYVALCVLSTALGVLRGEVNFKTSSFYVLKYIEYFLLYFMTVNIAASKEDLKKYLYYGGIVLVLVTLYAYYFYYNAGPDARASAPFEAKIGSPGEGEPASLGGYYLLALGFILAMITETGGRALLQAVALLAFVFPAFLFTFSRASYMGIAAIMAALLIFTRKRRIFLGGFFIVVLAGITLIPGLSEKVRNRISMTYSGQYATNEFNLGSAGSLKLEESAAMRVRSMRRTFVERLPKHLFFGWGVTGAGLCDTQYALILGELGLAGFFAFIWMIFRLFKMAKTVFRSYSEPWIRALSLGFMVSLVGLLAQAVGVNTFIVVRIMEPFWFLAAMIASLYIKRPGAAGATPAPPAAGPAGTP